MRIEELFEDHAEKFEFSNVVPKFTDPDVSRQVGTYDGYAIWGSRDLGAAYDAYGILDDDKRPLALLVIQTHEQLLDGRKLQQIEKIWVSPESRGKALGISLLGFVLQKLKTGLMSNPLLTPDGTKLYKKIIDKKSFDVAVFDKSKKRISDLGIVTSDDLFAYPNDYQIVLEHGPNSGVQFDRLFEPKFGDLRRFRTSELDEGLDLPAWD